MLCGRLARLPLNSRGRSEFVFPIGIQAAPHTGRANTRKPRSSVAFSTWCLAAAKSGKLGLVEASRGAERDSDRQPANRLFVTPLQAEVARASHWCRVRRSHLSGSTDRPDGAEAAVQPARAEVEETLADRPIGRTPASGRAVALVADQEPSRRLAYC